MSMLELRRVTKVYGQGTAGVDTLADVRLAPMREAPIMIFRSCRHRPRAAQYILARFIGIDGYGVGTLRDDLARYMFLLGETDGEGLFWPRTARWCVRASAAMGTSPLTVRIDLDTR